MNSQAEESAPVEIGPFAWIIFVLVLLVQQGAFVLLPIIINSETAAEMQELDNPLNRAALAVSLLFIGGMCLSQLRALADMARINILPMLFTGLVFLSTSWSIHPEITIRKALAYLLTILVAALLPLRLGVDRFMKVLSLSFAISGVGSFVFVLVAPQYGIMHEEGLEGCWQGVFCTKEFLGSAMAVAVFVEAYILVAGTGRQLWRFCLLALYGALVILSRSQTALLTVVLYSAGICVFLLWRRHRLLGLVGLLGIASALLTALVVVWSQPALFFTAVGKDATLTGRTLVWSLVSDLIDERPVLGWGYQAMWQLTDPATVRIREIAGFAVSSSHNAFLEIALELGWTGLVLMGFFIFGALRRGAQCLVKVHGPLGWFSIMFVIGALTAGLTTETLGRSQVIEWVVLNALVFSCGVSYQDVQKNKGIEMSSSMARLSYSTIDGPEAQRVPDAPVYR
jgi:exopolysaccharide production protein ExoQ